jgi:hypothetical protein
MHPSDNYHQGLISETEIVDRPDSKKVGSMNRSVGPEQKLRLLAVPVLLYLEPSLFCTGLGRRPDSNNPEKSRTLATNAFERQLVSHSP